MENTSRGRHLSVRGIRRIPSIVFRLGLRGGSTDSGRLRGLEGRRVFHGMWASTLVFGWR